MKHLAFLSMDNLEGFVSDDDLAIGPLRDLGWDVTSVSWRKPCDWNRFDMVIMRTTWDYQDDVVAFLRALEKIDASTAILQNDIETVKWNIEKTYLRELENKGNPIVPTLWENGGLTPDRFKHFFSTFKAQELIIKPVVSANADNTFRINPEKAMLQLDEMNRVFTEKPFMVQPFMENIIREGEYSLFFFAGEYSHTILKTPKKRDFRVQEEHGGIISSVGKDEILVEQSQMVLKSLGHIPLYARIDFVRDDTNEFLIMEVELIEPALYFRMDPPSAERFAQAVDSWDHNGR